MSLTLMPGWVTSLLSDAIPGLSMQGSLYVFFPCSTFSFRELTPNSSSSLKSFLCNHASRVSLLPSLRPQHHGPELSSHHNKPYFFLVLGTICASLFPTLQVFNGRRCFFHVFIISPSKNLQYRSINVLKKGTKGYPAELRKLESVD